MFHIESISPADLEGISRLQPADWTDIVPYFKFYLESDFCCPVKVAVNEIIVGIGVSVAFQNTAWIAHIIVDPEFRNQGIGAAIVDQLINNPVLKSKGSILLIATKMGEPVYLKKGFRVVTEYAFFRRESPWKDYPVSKNIQPFDKKYTHDILEMDGIISGEDRSRLLMTSLNGSLVYTDHERLLGYYMPGMGEGLIEAMDSTAGLELMKAKYASADKAVLPVENTAGIDFLKANGFIETSRANRMVLGTDIHWQPDKLFSRIGGNLG